jgi:hypothetical protein
MNHPFRKVSRMSSMNFLSGFFFKVGNGTSVRFWEDVWMGHLPLSQQYPTLYNMVQHKNVLISTVLATAPLNISFRRGLNDKKWLQWMHLCQRLMTINLSTKLDTGLFGNLLIRVYFQLSLCILTWWMDMLFLCVGIYGN